MPMCVSSFGFGLGRGPAIFLGSGMLPSAFAKARSTVRLLMPMLFGGSDRGGLHRIHLGRCSPLAETSPSWRGLSAASRRPYGPPRSGRLAAAW